jgi:glycopeptide antibiotics resistance protein
MRSSIHVTLFLVALSTLLIVHVLATNFYLYWKYGWLDMSVHVLGGTTIALGFFLLPLFNIRISKRFFTLLAVLLSVLVRGLFWEVYEYQFARTVQIGEQGFWIDTVTDLCMDTLGGFIGYSVATRLRNF